MKEKVWVTKPLFAEVVERLRHYFEVEVNLQEHALARDEFAQCLSDKCGALVMGDVVDASALAGAPLLRAVANMAVGYNNFDLDALGHAGVIATNTPDVLNETTADFGWALMMNVARRVGESERWVRRGAWRGWSHDQFLGQDIHGSTLGIIGMGRIGQAVARRALGFNMRVIYHNRSRVAPEVERQLNAQWVDKGDLLRRADHVLLVLPYSPASHGLIGARELGLMKPTATLTNIARGGIVDDAALVAALRERRIAGAALDVFEGEPALHPGFLALENVVLCPHIAPASDVTRRAMAHLAADNLIAALGYGPRAGSPPNIVNPH